MSLLSESTEQGSERDVRGLTARHHSAASEKKSQKICPVWRVDFD
jgi:hypothetical protein